MKKALFLCALGTALLGSQVAMADTFSLSFGGTFLNGTSFVSGGNGSGGSDITFNTAGTPTPGGLFDPNTYAISNLTGTVIIGGTTYSIGTLDTGLGGHNLLADNFLGILSPDGFDFDLTTTGNPNPDYTQLLIDYNSAAGQYDATVCNRKGTNCQPVTDATNFGADIYDISNAPAATPEPGSLALLGTSILGGAGILRRRLRA